MTMRKPEKKKKKPLKAAYGGATPKQVAEAVLRYRPEKPARHTGSKA